jgi:ABC-type transport system involved in multi-copper enzyme maturation permease subunit
VRIFLRDLVRRKMFWLLVAATVGVVAVIYGASRTMEDALGNGESWDVASKRAASHLDNLALSLRTSLPLLVTLLAAQLAPESRRNGTTQFVLSLGVRRDVLAFAQFTALSVLIVATTFIVHVGFAIAGIRAGATTWNEAGVAWITLLVPLLALAGAVFAVSLTWSGIETVLLFVGVPFMTRTLPNLANGYPKSIPMAFVRCFENVSLFFPEVDEVVQWPHLTYGSANGPLPTWQWPAAHLFLAVLFWVAFGVWRHRHHDFGSRTAVK